MKRTYVDRIGEYYDNLDSLIDMRASGMGPYVDEDDLRKIIYYANAEK